MDKLSRRSVLRASLGVAAVGALARPYISNAAAKTASVWWAQGFVKEEDIAFRDLVAAYEKASGNKIDYSIIPFAPLNQKIISALTSGDVPDLMAVDGAGARIVPQNAWADRLIDMSDVVETQKAHYHPTALLASRFYNSIEKRRAHYMTPFKTSVNPIHVWSSLVEKAGFRLADAPKTWDAFFDFFKPVQKKLREQGMRGVYSLGLQPTTAGPNDGNNTFHAFLIANGGKDLIGADGTPHLDDPQVKEAVVKSIRYITTAYKEGYVPPGALSWSDADDNNAFHAKQIVMDYDGTISTELALFHDKDAYADAVTIGMPLDNSGKPVPSQIGIGSTFMAKGAKNVEVAKDFTKYLIQPQVSNEFLKGGLGRWLPAMTELVHSDPFWLDPKDQHVKTYSEQGLLGPTVPVFPVYNPGCAEAEAQQTWGTAVADVVKEGMTPEAAADKALKRIGEILQKYPILES